ncbi:MAG: hypothetical protein KGP28_08825 [Bdellovibrionales bacterium]|nr:hypothetical protein [Bdellovibrionales bacterium]
MKFFLLFFGLIQALSLPSALSATSKDLAPGVLLEIMGNIYPVDQLPPGCGGILKGVRCADPSYGKFHVISKKEGEVTTSITTFSGPEGVQVTEKSWERGGRVQRAEIENLAIQKRSELEVRDGKVFYKVTDLTDGSTKTSEDDAEENLVVPSTVMAYIKPSFQQLKEGKEVRLKVAVPERRESYTFVMRKHQTGTAADGTEMMVLEMAPSSFIIKALVDPMYFYIKPGTGEMFAFEGRSALRRKQGDSYKEMKVQTAYDYRIKDVVRGVKTL